MVLDPIELEARQKRIRVVCEHMFVSRPRPTPPTPVVPRTGRPPATNRKCAVELRECRHHGRVEFALYGRKQQRWYYKKCVAENVTRRHQAVRRQLVAEAGGCCAICGYDRAIINLHFHHVDPSQKLFAVNSGVGKALATLRAEAAKCVLVCANCHGEIESGIVDSPAAGAKFPAP